MNEFQQAYINAALWSSMDESDDSGGEPLDSNYDQSDIDPRTLTKMLSDCNSFEEMNSNLLELAYNNEIVYSRSQAGHDFWLTRHGHGAGFWDRGLGKIGDKLTKASKTFGDFNLYVEDGIILTD